MDWLNRLNDALVYFEAHLAGKIDLQEAARIAGTSLTRFQRMFGFLSDMTLSEYIRARRMTLAAQELQQDRIKIIDLAAKYGYESPEAFTRAFRAFHGLSPTTLRRGGSARVQPPLQFELSIRDGNALLGHHPLVQLEDLQARRVAVFRAESAQPETDAWNALRSWATAHLTDYSARRCFGLAPQGHHPDGPEEAPHAYCAMLLLHGAEGDDATFHGAEVTDAPQGLFLVGDVALNEYDESGRIDIGASMVTASQTVYACLQQMGSYALDFPARSFLEEHVFDPAWFTAADHERILPNFRFWLPIRSLTL